MTDYTGWTVASYARHSDRKQDASVDQQNDAYRAWCAEHHATLVAGFEDRARSGRSTVGRDGLDQLLTYLARKPRPAQGVLLWASSRVSRNMDDAAWIKASIRRLGYELVYLGEPFLNSLTGAERRLAEHFVEYSDQKTSENIGRDVRRGMLAALGQGGVYGTPPACFRVEVDGERRRLVPDPATWERGRQAWAMRAGGATLREVHTATHLFQSGQGYRGFFANRLYTGTLVWGGQEFPGFAPALCTPEQWAAVQALVRDHPRRAASVYLLSGLIYCSCGHYMNGNSYRPKLAGGRRGLYRYYECKRADRFAGECAGPKVRADEVEQLVLRQLSADYLRPEILTPLLDQARTERQAARGSWAEQVADLKRRLAECQAAIDRLTEALEQGSGLASVAERLAAREAERRTLRVQLAALPPAESAPAAASALPTATALIRETRRQLRTGTPQEQRRLLKRWVERVDLAPDGTATVRFQLGL